MMSIGFTDPAPITRILRAKASSEILVSAVHDLNVFDVVDEHPMTIEDVGAALGLRNRPVMVLIPALCAMQLLAFDDRRRVCVTELGKYLTSKHPSHIRDYLGLEKNDPGVVRLREWLRNDGPADTTGMSYVKDDSAASPMDDMDTAHYFTMALAGRAKLISPVVAEYLPSSQGHLLDIAGGTGYYSYEWLLRNPAATATIADRPAVLASARKILDGFHGGSAVASRVQFLAVDMLNDELPVADILLAASLFHDWPEEVCEKLARKFAACLHPGGELWIHDAFLLDTFDGPLAVTDYSAMLFLGTRGRCYSRSEYRGWLRNAGLVPTDKNIPTLMDYHLISAVRQA